MSSVEYLGRLVSEVAGHIKCTNGCTVAVNIQAIIDQTDAPVLAAAEPNDDDGIVLQPFNGVVTPQLTPDRVQPDVQAPTAEQAAAAEELATDLGIDLSTDEDTPNDAA